jgi:hypothetical protein
VIQGQKVSQFGRERNAEAPTEGVKQSLLHHEWKAVYGNGEQLALAFII